MQYRRYHAWEATMTTRHAIESIGKELAYGINSKNAASISKLYTEDASLFPPDAPRQDGREAIQAFWQGAIDMGLSNAVLTTVEVEEFGNSAAEVGTVKATLPVGNEGPKALIGKYVVIWKKGAGGRWCLHRDIWNFDA
jgi:uncharacterized protein (TIGR02246 family)